MKKLICLLMIFLVGNLAFSEESVLYSSDADASCNEYDFNGNFKITSDSGYFNKENLKIKEPMDKGLPFIAENVPNYTTTHYDILVPYEAFLNTPNTGAGYIDNAAAIKSISVTASTNRAYDEIILMYKTTPTGETKYIKMPQNFDEIKSMQEFTLVYDNPGYLDIENRDLKNSSVIGSKSEGIYLVGIRVKTNIPPTNHEFCPYSFFFLKNISVIYDKAFTDEQITQSKEVKELFKIDEYSALREKEIKKIEEHKRLKKEEIEKMHASKEETSNISEK